MNNLTAKIACTLGMVTALSLASAETADARRGGSFGSRGARTYSAPPPTRTAPGETAPVQRSMTAPPAQGQQAARPAAPAAAAAGAQAPRRGGFLGGLGGGLLGGLLVGGLIGALMGHGLGTGAGAFLTILLQVAIVGIVVALLMRLFRRRQQPAIAGAGWSGQNVQRQAAAPIFGGGPDAAAAQYQPPPAARGPSLEIPVTQDDREAFERLLIEVQDAFGREDYAGLRERTTPEVMSYLSEELGQNATQGCRNDVVGTRLLEADVAEAWREDDRDYATAALRYESCDVIRDRQSGAVIKGDPDRPTEATELWTFVRPAGGQWKLSAIQEA